MCSTPGVLLVVAACARRESVNLDADGATLILLVVVSSWALWRISAIGWRRWRFCWRAWWRWLALRLAVR